MEKPDNDNDQRSHLERNQSQNPSQTSEIEVSAQGPIPQSIHATQHDEITQAA